MGDPLTDLILELAKHWGIPAPTAAALIPLIIIVANRVARLIPDNATGPLNWLRIVCVVLGLHVKDNSGVAAVQDKTGAVIRRADPESVPEEVETVEKVVSTAAAKGIFQKPADSATGESAEP